MRAGVVLALAVALAVGATGCHAVFGIADLGPSVDAAPIDADETPRCFGTNPDFDPICVPTGVVIPDVLDDLPVVDTDVDCTFVTIQTGGPDLCVRVARQIRIVPTQATGPRPLVLLAVDAIVVDASLDVSSHLTPDYLGAGADVMCELDGLDGAQSSLSTLGAGGGAGGTFVSGQGGTGGTTSTRGGDAAMPIATPLHVIRGGCPGGRGGAAGAGGGRPAVSHGGGAVAVIAGATITVDGRISASGGAGAGGLARSGGSGGGSGGLIVLDAPSVTVDGKLIANGGGGGEGASATIDGKDGFEGMTPTGGVSVENGGDGGAGAFATADAGNGIGDSGGGGGGGGGGGPGQIVIPDTASIGPGATISPR